MLKLRGPASWSANSSLTTGQLINREFTRRKEMPKTGFTRKTTKRTSRKTANAFRCDTCQISFDTESRLDLHNAAMHEQRVLRSGKAVPPQNVPVRMPSAGLRNLSASERTETLDRQFNEPKSMSRRDAEIMRLKNIIRGQTEKPVASSDIDGSVLELNLHRGSNTEPCEPVDDALFDHVTSALNKDTAQAGEAASEAAPVVETCNPKRKRSSFSRLSMDPPDMSSYVTDEADERASVITSTEEVRDGGGVLRVKPHDLKT